ncbi:aldo/keto reductase [Stereum hirsutum FP-91666 SS1]|uniref:aldo/keto reductase n=1 Tax=Stereum hirsutum (strain FP-91666) TaxID=721885 RepID=UPI000444A445|nr:aldo/keto reductase [Stereum hirsutum FP-91666 SS1]EIM84126.1 aldo/keto reductase [Stereum hirsutum FP-91666 SS1]
MTLTLIKLGGAASDITVCKTGHGLMMMTWTPTPVPDEQCFEAIKAGIDRLPAGVKMVLNSAEFYGYNPPTANLELLSRFFEKYPTYVDKAFLVVKVRAFQPQNLRRSVDECNAKLRGKKRIDVFECARFDQSKWTVEETIKSLLILRDEGKFDHIGISECSAASVRRASAVSPILTVEIEVSLWSYEEETKRVIAACKELDINVLAYSPLGRGFLTGQITKLSDLQEGDLRTFLGRFTEENIKENLALVEDLKAIAARKGVTPAQLAIAWVHSLGSHIIPIPGSSKQSRTLENLAAGEVVLADEDLKEIDALFEKHSIRGSRYIEGVPDTEQYLWG